MTIQFTFHGNKPLSFTIIPIYLSQQFRFVFHGNTDFAFQDNTDLLFMAIKFRLSQQYRFIFHDNKLLSFTIIFINLSLQCRFAFHDKKNLRFSRGETCAFPDSTDGPPHSNICWPVTINWICLSPLSSLLSTMFMEHCNSQQKNQILYWQMPQTFKCQMKYSIFF